MKYTLLSALIVGSLALTGCNSDSSDNDDEPVVIVPPVVVDPPEEPEEVVTVDVKDAAEINLSVVSYDSVTGALQFNLTDADGTAISNATDYDIAYMGFPDPAEKSSQAKAWKRWHVSQIFQCDSTTDTSCQGALVETETKGSYTFTADGLDLSTDDPAKAVKIYKVGIAIKGTDITNSVELLSPTS